MVSPGAPPEGYDPQKDPIEIVEYDPFWPEKFALEKRAIFHALGFMPGLKVEHFGSTSVPDMAAKPILDIMVGVSRKEDWPKLIKPIEMAGYLHWTLNPNPNEMFFVKGMPPFGKKRTHHLHVYELYGERWKRELAFRDYLVTHPQEAKNYEALKKNLALRFQYDREAYTGGKTAYIECVMKKIKEGNGTHAQH